jgi:hypothetical protein
MLLFTGILGTVLSPFYEAVLAVIFTVFNLR